MQYYKNHPSYMFHPGANDEAMYGTYIGGDQTHDCIFSKVGCVEAGAAKMSSEILGEDVPLIYINNLFDTDKDGNLSLLVYLKGDISRVLFDNNQQFLLYLSVNQHWVSSLKYCLPN